MSKQLEGINLNDSADPTFLNTSISQSDSAPFDVDLADVTNAPSTPFYIRIWKNSNEVITYQRSLSEIMKVSAVNGSTLTVDQRAVGDTNKLDFSTGDLVTVGNALPVDKAYYGSGDFDTDFAAKTTDALPEGTSNKYFTEQRVQNVVNKDSYESATRVYVDKEEGTDVPIDYDETNFSVLPGRSENTAFETIGRAIEEINQNIRSTEQIYDDPDPLAIKVAAGTYTVENPIVVPDKVSLAGDSLRSVIIKPQNPKADVFHVHRLNYIENVRIKDTQFPSFSVAFPSATIETEIGSGVLTEANIVYSPTGYECDYENVFKNKYPVESSFADLPTPQREGQLAAVENGTDVTIYSTVENGGSLAWNEFASNTDGSIIDGVIQPLKPEARVNEPRSGERAEVQLSINNGKINGASVKNGGSGYSLKPTVSVAAPARKQPWVNGSPYVQNASSITGPFTEKDADGNRKEIPDTMPLPYDKSNPGTDPITGETINRAVDDHGSGGGMKIDGRVCQGWNKLADNHPALQNIPRSPLKSMVGAQYTQVNQAGPGHLLLNDGFGQFVSCFTTFSTYSYRCNSGGLALVSNSVSDFGNEGLVAEGKYDVPYTTGTLTTSEKSKVASVRVQESGFDYEKSDTIDIEPPASGTSAEVSMTVQDGEITGVTVDNRGSGYVSTPEVTVSTSTGQEASFEVDMNKVGTVNVENLDTFKQAGTEEITQRPQIATVLDLEGQDRDITNWTEKDDGTYDVTFFPAAFQVSAGTDVSFHQNSRINSGGHTYEFVGSGTTYNALPEYGGIADPAEQETETGAGRVFITSSDQRGNFRIGDAFRVDQTTGEVTIDTDRFNLSGLNAVGPFRVNGVNVGVQLREVTNRSDMRSTSGLSGNTVPTIDSVRGWAENSGIAVPKAGLDDQVLMKQSGVDRDADWEYVKYSQVQNTPNDTDGIPEGTSNLYFTNERVDDRVNGLLKAGTHVSKAYDDEGGTLTLDVDDALSAYTNDAGYITDYTVTQSDVTQHEGALTITESQISDLSHYTDEEAQDAVNNLLAEGTNISLTYDDANNTLEIASTDSQVLSGGTDISIDASNNINFTNDTGYITSVTQSDVTQHEGAITITENQISDLSHYTDEEAQDAVGTILSSEFNYDDANGSISLDSSVTDTYSDEQAQDAVNALLSAGTNVNLSYDDAGNSLTIDASDTTYTGGTDITVNASNEIVFNNNTGYITGYSVTESDVTQHESALTITENQISDLSHYSDEQAQDAVNTLLTGGSNINLAYDDANNDLTISTTAQGVDIEDGTDGSALVSGVTAIQFDGNLSVTDDGDGTVTVDASSSQVLSGGTDISIDGSNNINFVNNTGYITGYTVTETDVTQHESALSITESQISDLSHYGDADVDSLLTGGSDISLTYDSANSTLTIDGTDTQLSNEEVQDTVNDFLSAGSGANLNYDDQNNNLTVGAGRLRGSGKPESTLGDNGDIYVNENAKNKGLMLDVSSVKPSMGETIAKHYQDQLALVSVDENANALVFNVSYSDGSNEKRLLSLQGSSSKISVQNDGNSVDSVGNLNFAQNIDAKDITNGAEISSYLSISDKNSPLSFNANSIQAGDGMALQNNSGEAIIEPTRFLGKGAPVSSLGSNKDLYIDERVESQGVINPLATHSPSETANYADKYSSVSEQILLATVDETNDTITFEVSYSDGTRKSGTISLT